MEKKALDYLFLYLGCDVLTPDGIARLTSVSLLGKRVGTLVGGMSIEKQYKFSEIQLTLRPLSDMTEEEELERYGICDNLDLLHISDLFKKHALETHYLLSKHFDLFGLIEAGLAIDKTKMNIESK